MATTPAMKILDIRSPIACTLAILLVAPISAWAQPKSGEVFREYLWTNGGGDAGGSLRVGGRVGYGGSSIKVPHEIDLAYASRAEIVMEKLLCHDGTRGLEISINNNPWIRVPEAESIAEPPWEYQHHTYPIVPLPLSQLSADSENQFRLRVSDEHPWNWPQHLIYGVHFRVYYDPAKKPHPAGHLVAPQAEDKLAATTTLQAEATSPNGPIRQADYLGLFEGVNLEGDGRYRQWHYHYVRAELAGHLGTVHRSPWKLNWDTTWIPDQSQPFQLAARITDATGLTYLTHAVEGLTLDRGGTSVELCKPYDVPKKWVTRSGEHTEKFRVTGDLDKAMAARLVWCSWSPGYMEGVFINGQEVLRREGPRYAYYVHQVPLADLSVLRPGENVLATGKTPKYDGKMVHGMEVNWPGIMVLIQYRK